MPRGGEPVAELPKVAPDGESPQEEKKEEEKAAEEGKQEGGGEGENKKTQKRQQRAPRGLRVLSALWKW